MGLLIVYNRNKNNSNDIIKDKGLAMDISSVLDGLDKSEEPANENPIVKELNQLDHRSFEMARLIAQSNKERSDLREEVLEIINRLDSLAEKIETEQPGLYDKVADQISESLLDLSYVELETDMLSLRLGEFLRNSNSLNQTTASEQTTTGQTQMIQSKEGSKIKKAVYHFLMHVIGVDLPESDTFISMLPEPIQDFDEVRGTFRSYPTSLHGVYRQTPHRAYTKRR